MIKAWVCFVRQHYSPNTYRAYTSTIWRFQKFHAPKFATDLTLEHIEQYLLSLKGLSNKSKNQHLVALKSFSAWLETHHNIPNPTRKAKKLPEHSKHRFLTEDEYQAVLSVCSPSERDTIEFLANTGLRADELLHLDATSLTADHKWIHVLGKGGKSRIVPTNTTVRSIIERHPHFNFSKNYLCLYRTCQSLGRRARISPFGPHALRHFMATSLMRKGISLYKISKILGNSLEVCEKTYIHFLAQIDLDGVTDVLDK